MKAWILTALSVLFAVAPAAGTRQAPQKAAPASVAKAEFDAETLAERKKDAERLRLFRSDDTLPITLTADFKAVMRDRDPKSTKTFPATITFPHDGATTTMPLRIRARGHSRRSPITCTFTPLRLEFDKTLTKRTVFDGHGPLKLGTHCRGGKEDIILREYVIYRMFNILTPNSFRARVANVTYLDAATGKPVAEEAGLLIEDDDDVAKRLEGRSVSMQGAVFGRLDQDALAMMMLFEYLIGNTDLSIVAQHNVRIVAPQSGRPIPVPYDFDYSGLVDSGYGAVGRGLPITDVRDRLYRGPCRTEADWKPYIDKVRDAKPKFMELFDKVEGLNPAYRKTAKAYLEEFYRNIERRGEVKRALIDRCYKTGM
jgi:hypothetical protein